MRVWSSVTFGTEGVVTGSAGVLEDLTAMRGAEAQSRTLESKLQQTHELVSLALLAGEHATALAAQLLAYSGCGAIAAQPVHLTRAVEETFALLRSTIPTRVRVTLELARVLYPMTSDATRLRQVVMNLLTSATDSISEAEGAVVIRSGTQMVDARGGLTAAGSLAPRGPFG